MTKSKMTSEPHHRLTILANDMIEELQNFGGTENVKAIVMLTEGDRSGIGIGGYESGSDAMVMLFVHLAAMFEANGKKLMLVPLRQG